jgi:hypothetical protein
VNGSPTCTEGRFASDASISSDAKLRGCHLCRRRTNYKYRVANPLAVAFAIIIFNNTAIGLLRDYRGSFHQNIFLRQPWVHRGNCRNHHSFYNIDTLVGLRRFFGVNASKSQIRAAMVLPLWRSITQKFANSCCCALVRFDCEDDCAIQFPKATARPHYLQVRRFFAKQPSRQAGRFLISVLSSYERCLTITE